MIEIIKQGKKLIVKDSRRKELNELKKNLPKNVVDNLDRVTELEREIKEKKVK